jgi:uncharacterized NAD-dependent epimerase/dehydratase family protein
VRIRDIRKPPPRKRAAFLHRPHRDRCRALKIAILGTDSAVGKRTTAWLLVKGLRRRGICRTEMIGTGQTAWLQGARYGVVMDALVNDFVSGEIEHAVCRAWQESRPDVIVIEGPGQPHEPGLPGRFRNPGRRTAGHRHPPARPGPQGIRRLSRLSRFTPLERQIEAIEMLSGKPVVAADHQPRKYRSDRHRTRSVRQVQARSRTTGPSTCSPTVRRSLIDVDTILPWIEKRGRGMKDGYDIRRRTAAATLGAPT